MCRGRRRDTWSSAQPRPVLPGVGGAGLCLPGVRDRCERPSTLLNAAALPMATMTPVIDSAEAQRRPIGAAAAPCCRGAAALRGAPPLDAASARAGAATAPPCPRPCEGRPAIPARSPYVGMNLGAVRYWTTAFPFADMVKNGSGWSSRDDRGTWGGNLAGPSRTATRRPSSRASARCWRSPGRGTRYPIGRYTVLWDGKGRVGFPLNRVSVRRRRAESDRRRRHRQQRAAVRGDQGNPGRRSGSQRPRALAGDRAESSRPSRSTRTSSRSWRPFRCCASWTGAGPTRRRWSSGPTGRKRPT